MKLSDCRIGILIIEKEEYIKKIGRKKRRIGYIKDFSMNCTNEIILVVRFPIDLYTYEDIALHCCNVEIYKEDKTKVHDSYCCKEHEWIEM